jgi:cytoskeletal protein RodZ
MRSRSALLLIIFFLAIAGCDPVPVQYPPGSVQNPNSSSTNPPQPQPPQVNGSQRWQHAWETAMQGVAMGGSIGGVYGAGGGLIIGLITGLITADAHYAQINNQIYTEQKKDQQLEAAIDQELERQRNLENKIASATAPSSASPAPNSPAAQASPPQPTPRRGSPQQNKQSDNTQVASLGKPAAPNPVSTPFKNVEVRDTNGDGIPDLWVYYNPQKPGEIVRQEESTKHNGNVDTWSYFKDGKLVRREVDTKGQGRADTFFFYDNEMITREERDETGQGRVTYRGFYQNGRLAKVEKDTTDHGRTDLWIYYDTAKEGEVVIKEERDLDGDGSVDLWTYFENGRMVRRDVSAVGLALLTQQDKLPISAGDIKPIAAPGS